MPDSSPAARMTHALPLWMVIGRDEFTFGQHVAVHRPQQRIAVGSRRKIKHAVERKDLKVVVVWRIAFRRLGPEVSQRAGGIAPLHRAIRLQ